MASFNKVILIGRLGQDPEVRSTQSGKKLATFSIATTDFGANAKTQWHNLVCWEKTAEIAEKYLKKGKEVCVEGRISYEEYEKDGVKKYTTKINVDQLQMLGTKDNNQAEDAATASAQTAATPAAAAKTAKPAAKKEEKAPQMAAPAADDSDDLPF